MNCPLAGVSTEGAVLTGDPDFPLPLESSHHREVAPGITLFQVLEEAIPSLPGFSVTLVFLVLEVTQPSALVPCHKREEKSCLLQTRF